MSTTTTVMHCLGCGIHLPLRPPGFGESAKVKVATEGAEAIEIAEDRHPEIVLLDLMMPGMDGFEVAARLPSGTKIVAVTALAGDDQRVQAAHFDRYIAKPVLEGAVGQVIQQLSHS